MSGLTIEIAGTSGLSRRDGLEEKIGLLVAGITYVSERLQPAQEKAAALARMTQAADQVPVASRERHAVTLKHLLVELVGQWVLCAEVSGVLLLRQGAEGPAVELAEADPPGRA